MLIDLDNKREDLLTFDIGDILIFDDKYPRTYYLVIHDDSAFEYKLLSLSTYESFKGYDSIDDLIIACNNVEINDGVKLIEVIKSDQVILKRAENAD